MSAATTATAMTCGVGQSHFDEAEAEAPASASRMLTRDGPVTYIVAELDTRPGNRVDQRVGLGLGGADTRSQSNSAKNAPPARDNMACVLTRPGVKYFSRLCGRTIEAVDDIALSHFV